MEFESQHNIKNKYDTKKIMLIITEACNLNCTYCYEHNKTNSVMSFNTAREIIDREFKDLSMFKKGAIEFFGGEAFLNFPLIKDVFEYVCKNYPDEEIKFYCTTNGTLVHGEIQNWLSKHKERFICSLSLDGTKEMHDTNRFFRDSGRSGSFDSIDIDFFLKTWSNQTAKMTVSEETLPKLAEGVKFIEKLGFECIATFATGIEWTNNENMNLLINQLSQLIDYYEKNPNQRLCKMLNLRLNAIFEETGDDFRYCGAGIAMRSYDVKGDCYPCQGFAPISIGAERAKEYLNCDFMDFHLSHDNPCKKCRFLRVCTTCFAANYSTTGSLEKQIPEICLFNRLCILASSKIQYLRIMSKGEENLTVDDQKTLKAISIIQENVLNDNENFIKKDPRLS